MMSNYCFTAIRPVPYLSSYTPKLQLSKKKFSQFLWKSNGKILSFIKFFALRLLLQPNMNAFRFLVWPCTSQNMNTSRVALVYAIIFLTSQISGASLMLSLSHYLLKSSPFSAVRELPRTTPSIFNIGTILKTKRFLSCIAYLLDESKNSIIPSIAYEA